MESGRRMMQDDRTLTYLDCNHGHLPDTCEMKLCVIQMKSRPLRSRTEQRSLNPNNQKNAAGWACKPCGNE